VTGPNQDAAIARPQTIDVSLVANQVVRGGLVRNGDLDRLRPVERRDSGGDAMACVEVVRERRGARIEMDAGQQFEADTVAVKTGGDDDEDAAKKDDKDAKKDDKDADKPAKPEKLKIDVAGIADRVVALAVPPGSYFNLQFADGKLTAQITKTNFNINGSTVTKIPAADTSFTLTTTATFGAFTGTIRPNWMPTATALPAFKGIILQKGANQGGFGFFLSNIPSDLDPQSGGVSLTN
jgi:hypothetical protein